VGAEFRRYRERYDEDGLAGLADRRLGKASFWRVPIDKIAWMLGQYRTHQMGWNLKHFHEHLQRSMTFAGAIPGPSCNCRQPGLSIGPADAGRIGASGRKPCVGMMLHQDASPFAWIEGAPDLDLVVTMDDATSEIYSAFLVEEEGVVSTLRGLLEVFAAKGLPSSLYSDRGSHYFFTRRPASRSTRSNSPRSGGRWHGWESSTFRPIRRRHAAEASACSGHPAGPAIEGAELVRHRRHRPRQHQVCSSRPVRRSASGSRICCRSFRR
jgi:hypothetical protein